MVNAKLTVFYFISYISIKIEFIIFKLMNKSLSNKAKFIQTKRRMEFIEFLEYKYI